MDIDKIIRGQAVKLRIDHLTGNLSEMECKTFIEKLLEAINFTDSSAELPSKEVISFKTWLNSFEKQGEYYVVSTACIFDYDWMLVKYDREITNKAIIQNGLAMCSADIKNYTK